MVAGWAPRISQKPCLGARLLTFKTSPKLKLLQITKNSAGTYTPDCLLSVSPDARYIQRIAADFGRSMLALAKEADAAESQIAMAG
jgi:hypothetical protein